ncbi:frataxin, mitochondrial, putative [Bodo saltans]|uniref:Frataxin, mitochondrial, putative n=1 Tax=Bodo saltans TaxID=75058 RepID=A0A0S4ITQ9_BODSA|nr:frataxin, mitochondrial, putative [Bodo saltans]|eukprot:CUF13011.1 frataxin, mitochondrial, putative [Bodo saltans]
MILKGAQLKKNSKTKLNILFRVAFISKTFTLMRRAQHTLPHLLLSSSAAVRLHQSKAGMEGFHNIAFNSAADALLEEMESAIEACDSDVVEDINYSDGVLNIDTTKGSFVLNKQAPNIQLWLSSPISGPHHYNMINEEGRVVWRSDKDQHDLVEKMERELSEVLSVKVAISSPAE